MSARVPATDVDARSGADPVLWVGALWFTAMAVMNVIIGVCYKLIGQSLVSGDIVILRCACSLILLAAIYKIARKVYLLSSLFLHMIRGTAAAVAWLCITHAYVALPLSLAQVLIYSESMFIAPISYLLLSEQQKKSDYLSVIIGMMGILFVSIPAIADSALSISITSVFIALIGSVAFALVIVLTGMISEKCPTTSVLDIQLTSTIIAISVFLGLSFFGALSSLLSPLPELAASVATLPWMSSAMIGACACAGLLAGWFMTKALKSCRASALAPGGLIALPLGYLVGAVVFDETLPALFVVGASLILCSVVLPSVLDHIDR